MKKNIRKIPNAVRSKLRNLRGQDIVAGCACQFSAQVLRDGALEHLQLNLRDDGFSYPERIVPPSSQGKYSARNVEGYGKTRDSHEWRFLKELMRRNLPHRQEVTYEFENTALAVKENKNCLYKVISSIWG